MIRKYLIFMLMCNVFVVFDAFSYHDGHKRNDDCSGDQAFESKTSSTCVACPQTASQGVAIAEDGSRYCLKCDADTQIFKNKACKEKTSLTKLTFTNQADCFACENPSDMKKCLKKKAGGAESGVVTDCAKYVGGTVASQWLARPWQGNSVYNSSYKAQVNSNNVEAVLKVPYSVASGM